VTLALAIIGAITGSVAMTLDLLRYAFDRPRLVVGFKVTRSVEVPAMIGIDVTNRGRRPTTILKAAFRSESEADSLPWDGPPPSAEATPPGAGAAAYENPSASRPSNAARPASVGSAQEPVRGLPARPGGGRRAPLLTETAWANDGR
jgi:hypothetical protein